MGRIAKTLWILLVLLLVLGTKTIYDVQPVCAKFDVVIRNQESYRFFDRYGVPLTVTYQTQWNDHDRLSLHKFPEFLVNALVFSEDQHFYDHQGIDWRAKGAALWQNIRARRIVRGASTLTEQVTHLITQRPRSFGSKIWHKWLGIIESYQLERRWSKNDILEFYLNQVPFASNRRGMVQAARYYFNRDLSTLTQKEMLALVLLIKAPSAYDLKKSVHQIEKRLASFLQKLEKRGYISPQEREKIQGMPLVLATSQLSIQATHFVQYLKQSHSSFFEKHPSKRIVTTIDGVLQTKIQKLLDERIRRLSYRHVQNGAVLVLNHQTGEILAWVVGQGTGKEGSDINAVLVPRQPGSVLKPFVYALALEKGWTAATLIDDEPLVGPVGQGLHRFRNYSKTYYGPVTVREALANSLNVPAVKTIQYVGVDACLKAFRELGLTTLKADASFYEEGLALGNGEITLFDLLKAYRVFAQKEGSRPIHGVKDFGEGGSEIPGGENVPFTPGTISIINNILSDPWARHWEFGVSSILNLSVQTALKTGTSSDYRDAWIVGYNHHYSVGIWMGNTDNSPMKEVTGSTGPALLLRSIFSELNRHDMPEQLSMSPDVVQKTVCLKRKSCEACQWQSEWFKERLDKISGEEASEPEVFDFQPREKSRIGYKKPTPGLLLAIDPRIPLEKQKFEFELDSLGRGNRVQWKLNGTVLDETSTPRLLWPLQGGTHDLEAIIYQDDVALHTLPRIRFTVKG